MKSEPQLQCGQPFRAARGLQLHSLCPYDSESALGLLPRLKLILLLYSTKHVPNTGILSMFETPKVYDRGLIEGKIQTSAW
jgi:hypothetical protein